MKKNKKKVEWEKEKRKKKENKEKQRMWQVLALIVVVRGERIWKNVSAIGFGFHCVFWFTPLWYVT